MKKIFITALLIGIVSAIFAAPKIIYKTIFIDCKKANCSEDRSTMCFRYKVNPKESYKILESKSLKFKYTEGFEYKIRIKTKKDNEEDYTFVKILSKTRKKNCGVTKLSNTKPSLPVNSQWILASFADDNKQVDKSTYFTIHENLIQVRGNGGCNSFGAKVYINENQISFSDIMQTEMFCAEKDEQERKFFKFLQTANRFEIIGGEMMLYENNKLLMTFESYRN